MSIWKRPCARFGFAFAFVLVLLLGGCMTILDTTDLHEAGKPCSISTGAYHLPKRMIKVTVSYDQDTTPDSYHLDIANDLIPAADSDERYCLDYLANPFTEDRVGISRSTDGLLQRIFTEADDKSDEIAIRLIEGVGDAVAGALGTGRSLEGRIRDGTSTVVGIYEFDPFDEVAMGEVNAALRRFGYCIYLDGRRDRYVPEWSARLCDVHTEEAHWEKDVAEPDHGIMSMLRRVRHLMSSRGILYRPNITHSLVVLKRPDPTSGEPWLLDTKRRIEMPNAAPVFSVQVERSMFVNRKTDLFFDNGVLTNVSINKESELEAFMNIPLAAAQVIVAIPTQILKIRINTANNRQALIHANFQLLQAINETKKVTDPPKPEVNTAQPQPQSNNAGLSTGQRSLAPSTATATTGTVDFNQCVNTCRVESGETQCRTYCTCFQDFCLGQGDATSCTSYCATQAVKLQ